MPPTVFNVLLGVVLALAFVADFPPETFRVHFSYLIFLDIQYYSNRCTLFLQLIFAFSIEVGYNEKQGPKMTWQNSKTWPNWAESKGESQ